MRLEVAPPPARPTARSSPIACGGWRRRSAPSHRDRRPRGVAGGFGRARQTRAGFAVFKGLRRISRATLSLSFPREAGSSSAAPRLARSSVSAASGCCFRGHDRKTRAGFESFQGVAADFSGVSRLFRRLSKKCGPARKAALFMGIAAGMGASACREFKQLPRLRDRPAEAKAVGSISLFELTQFSDYRNQKVVSAPVLPKRQTDAAHASAALTTADSGVVGWPMRRDSALLSSNSTPLAISGSQLAIASAMNPGRPWAF